jgi:nitroreductase
MDTELAIASKREVRAYADRPIPDDVKRRILEAGRVAGSSANKQQRRFVVVESFDALQRLAGAVYVSSNIATAGLVVAIVGEGGPLGFDAGRAGQNMMLAAWNEEVGSCPNGISDPDTARGVLALGADEQIAIILTFGYPAKPADPARHSPAEWIERASRKPFDEIVSTV